MYIAWCSECSGKIVFYKICHILGQCYSLPLLFVLLCPNYHIMVPLNGKLHFGTVLDILVTYSIWIYLHPEQLFSKGSFAFFLFTRYLRKFFCGSFIISLNFLKFYFIVYSSILPIYLSPFSY